MCKCTLLANAGLLLEMGNRRYLVDALYGKEGHPFSVVSPLMRRNMERPDSPFHGVDYVMFTHDHPDHFSASATAEYLRVHRVRRVLLPREQYAVGAAEALREQLRRDNVPCWELGLPVGARHVYRLEEGALLLAIGMRHMEGRFRGSQCDALLLSRGGKKILLLSDCDYSDVSAYAFLQGVSVDAICINPLFFHAEQGRQILSLLAPRQILIYHIPFEEDDTLALRSLVRQDMRRYGAMFSCVQPLLREGQSFSL